MAFVSREYQRLSRLHQKFESLENYHLFRYEDLLANDNEMDVTFRRTMAERGIFMVPTAIKRNHVSAAHTDADIDRTLETAREVLRDIAA